MKEGDSHSPGIIPSTQSLRAFDAVARFGSTVRAAAYLNVTQSAITHQLRNLEEQLGTQLVRRTGRNLELTSSGNRYAKQVRNALEIISQAALPANKDEPSGNLTINSTYGFGTFWLSGHLGKFCNLYPDLSIRVVTPAENIDPYSNEIDVSIVYGDSVWPDMHVQLLYSPDFFPVCSPLLISSISELSHPNDLASYSLLHHHDYNDWAGWLTSAGATNVDVRRGTIFSDINHCLSAAIAGLGIAMGDSILCHQSLREGTLVKLLRTTVPGPQSYYIVVRQDKKDNANCSAFINWLITEFDNKL